MIGTHSVGVLAPGGAGTEVGRNYLVNPRFVGTTGWTGVTAGGAVTSTTPYSPNTLSATGETWTGSIDITNLQGVTEAGDIRLRPTNNGSFTGTYSTTPFTIPPGETLRVAHTETIPAGANGFRLQVVNIAIGGTTVGRAMMEHAATPGPYFDGDSLDNPAATYSWVGTANASESKRMSHVVADLSCFVDEVSIVHGRDDPGSQPEASACTVDFTVSPDDPLSALVDVGTSIVAATTTVYGHSVRFVGKVTDLNLGWNDAGEDTPEAGIGQLVAVGALADLGRRVVGDTPWPQELDGARVARIMAAAGAALDPLYSDPGTVQLLARDVDAQAALEVARAAAVDATGILWQTRTGVTRYADANHRRRTPNSLTLDSCDLLVTPTWRRNIEGLVNEVSIGYGVAPEGGEQPRYVATSTTSVDKWGRYGYTSGTELADLAAAQAMGELLLVRNADPVWVMAALPVDVDGLDSARYAALLALDVHSLMTLTGLPSLGHAPTSANLWVEGWHETLSWGVHDVELTVSGYCRTAPPPTWDDLDPSWVWDSITEVESRRNLITNPSVEVDDTGWVAVGVGTVLAVAASSTNYGANILRATLGVNAFSGAYFPVPATVGTRYGFRASVRTPDGPLDIYARMQFVDAGNAQISIADGALITTPGTSGFTTLSIEATAPAGAVTVRVYVERKAADATVGQRLFIDGARLSALTPTQTFNPTLYFDGDTTDTTDHSYSWVGAPHASESVELARVGVPTGLPPELTWDDSTCLGPSVPNLGRWSDQPASLRWNQLPAASTWNNYRTPTA